MFYIMLLIKKIIKVKLDYVQLEYDVDHLMVPLNRVFNSVRPHLPCGKVLIRSFVVALTGASREGRLWACIPWPGKQT